MAAKTGGNRRAAAAPTAAAAGVSPADVQETLIPETASAVEVLAAVSGVPVEEVAEIAVEVVAATELVEGDTQPADDEAAPVADRSSLLAKFTGAPEPAPAVATVVPEVQATGAEQTWVDGDEPLVTAVVAFDMLRAVVDGVRKQAPKGTTLHATEAVIARGEALGAVVRVEP